MQRCGHRRDRLWRGSGVLPAAVHADTTTSWTHATATDSTPPQLHQRYWCVLRAGYMQRCGHRRDRLWRRSGVLPAAVHADTTTAISWTHATATDTSTSSTYTTSATNDTDTDTSSTYTAAPSWPHAIRTGTAHLGVSCESNLRGVVFGDLRAVPSVPPEHVPMRTRLRWYFGMPVLLSGDCSTVPAAAIPRCHTHAHATCSTLHAYPHAGAYTHTYTYPTTTAITTAAVATHGNDT